MEREWRNFYCRRRKPRVSFKTADQGLRSTRWLQLPYWATGILMCVNTALHWLVSQTMFVVEILKDNSFDSEFYINYSPLAIMTIGIASSILVLCISGPTLFFERGKLYIVIFWPA